MGASSRKIESQPATSVVPLGLLITVGIDLFIDGTLVGVGATLGSTQGLVLTIALTLEILFLALSVSAELADQGASRRTAALVPSALGLTTAIGAIAGAAVLGNANTATQAAVLAFGAAALLYLVTEELLVEAHGSTRNPTTRWHVLPRLHHHLHPRRMKPHHARRLTPAPHRNREWPRCDR